MIEKYYLTFLKSNEVSISDILVPITITHSEIQIMEDHNNTII